MDKDISFYQLSQLWLNNATSCVCYNWQNNLTSAVKHLNRFLYSKKVNEIKPFEIDNVILSLARYNPNTKKPASKKLLKNVVSVAQRIFDFAIENEIMYKNPAKNKNKIIPKFAPQKDVIGITTEQQQLVIDVQHKCQIAAIIMMFMGLRTGELLALEWQDVDLNQMQISVNKRTQKIESNKYIVRAGTKNGKVRSVSIPSNLAKWLDRQKNISTSYLVLPNSSGGVNSPTQWNRLWKSYQTEINYYCYCKKSIANGITPQNKFCPSGIPKVINPFNPHQLRHTYATLLYISGVDVLTASELLGHSDISTTLKIYTHLEKQFVKLNITKFDDYIKSDLDIKSIEI